MGLLYFILGMMIGGMLGFIMVAILVAAHDSSVYDDELQAEAMQEEWEKRRKKKEPK